jgi:hypothetical protein
MTNDFSASSYTSDSGPLVRGHNKSVANCLTATKSRSSMTNHGFGSVQLAVFPSRREIGGEVPVPTGHTMLVVLLPEPGATTIDGLAKTLIATQRGRLIGAPVVTSKKVKCLKVSNLYICMRVCVYSFCSWMWGKLFISIS